jgi:dTDP-4-amino-4,6-dideoxygalactose transaminase
MRVIIAVDYAGPPCDYDTLQWLAKRYGLALVAEGALWVPWRTSASSVFIR